jgi:hypothetical protein
MLVEAPEGVKVERWRSGMLMKKETQSSRI